MSTLSPAPAATVHADLQKMVEEGRLTAAAARTLSLLEPGAYTQHKSWGFGQVAAWNLDGNQILIDFGPRKSHAMQLQYAGDNLKPLPADHPLARKSSDLPGVKKQAAEDPAALLRSILQHSDGHRATPTQIAALLTPEVVSGDAEFKRWWESAKKQLKKDGRFVIPAKKTDFVEMREESLDHNGEILARFGQARQLKTQLGVLDEISKNIEDFKARPDGLAAVLDAAGASAVRNQRLDIDAAFELLVTRDEIANTVGITLPPDAPLLTSMMRDEEGRLGEIIGNLPAAKQRFALFQMPAALGEDKWAGRALSLLPQTHNARVVGEVARLFDSQGRTEEMRTFLDRSIRDYSVTCEMLLWLCKERDNEKYADFASPRLFKAILSAIERDGLSDIKRSTRLHDLLSSDRTLVTEILKDADHSELRSAARALLATPALEELDKRSLMARLMKLHPELQNLLTGGGEEKPQALIVSWGSLEKRKARTRRPGQQADSQEHRGDFGRAVLRRSARELRVQGGQGDAERPGAPPRRDGARPDARAGHELREPGHQSGVHRHGGHAHERGRQGQGDVHDSGCLGRQPGQGDSVVPDDHRAGASGSQGRRDDHAARQERGGFAAGEDRVDQGVPDAGDLERSLLN